MLLKKFKSATCFLTRYRWRLVLGFSSLLLTNLAQALIPRLLGEAVDVLRIDQNNLSRVNTFCLLIFGCTLLRAGFQFSMRYFIIGVSRRVEYLVRNRLFQHLQTLSFSYFNQTKTGDLMARATADVEAVRMVIGPGLMYICNTMVVVPAALFMMFTMSVPLTLMSMFPLVVLSVVMRKFSPKLHQLSKRVQDLLSDLSSRAQESISGVRVIKAFSQERREENSFEAVSKDYLNSNVALARTRGVTVTSIWVLADIGTLILLWVGGGKIINNTLTLGEFVAFNSYHLMLLWPMIALGWVIALYQRGVAAMERIDEVLSTEPEIQDKEGIKEIQSLRGEIEFRNLNFSYGVDHETALSDISFKATAGSTVAIVGPTGSGKSTIVNLVPHLFQVERGMLFIDGMDIHDVPLRLLRNSVGYVPQDAFLFSDTIANNIAYGIHNATDEIIVAAAGAAAVADQIREFPHGFAQRIGERGVNLSGGQKQRISIARAIIRKPTILILDDCLSAVDTETEAKLLEELRRIRKDRTTLVVAHRISTIQDADLILVLDDGKIVERGKHEELVKKGGLYANLFRMQRLQEDLEEIQ